uniref:Voltage-dependent anion-selective channel n=1 Tax=Strongyloides stercoralis TaxID=6248 RepID=A0A0K0ESQ7_STRER
MSQPTYKDIGKSANDFIYKGYNIDVFKIDIKNFKNSKKPHEFSTSINHNFDSKVFESNIKFKYKLDQYQTIFGGKWSSKNVITASLELFDHIIKGLSVYLESNYNLMNCNRSATIKIDCNTPLYRLSNKINLTGNPILDSFFVMSNKNCVAGVHVTTDINKKEIKSLDVCLSRTDNDYEINSFIKNGIDYGGSFVYNLSSNFQVGGKVLINQSIKTSSYCIGSKYNTTQDVTIKTKINNDSRLFIAAKQRLTSAFSLMGTVNFSLFSLNYKPPKIGFCVEYYT